MAILTIKSLSDVSDQSIALDELFGGLSRKLEEGVAGELKEAVILREETSSTYLDNGLAVPHARINSLEDIVVSVGLNSYGINWPDDDSKARIIIMIGVPSPMVAGYLRLLQRIIKWHKSSKLVQKNGIVDPNDIEILEKELLSLIG